MTARMSLGRMNQRPDLRRFVGVCMTCRHWQIDVRPGAISDLGGAQEALMTIAQAHADHIGQSSTPSDDQCPGAGGRVNYAGQWVEAPLMDSGAQASGTLEFNPFPRWWAAS